MRAERLEPCDLDAQISEILNQLTDNTEVWKGLTARFRDSSDD